MVHHIVLFPIDTPWTLCYFSVGPKMAFIFPIPYLVGFQRLIQALRRPLLRHPIVGDERIRENENLAAIRRIGQRLRSLTCQYRIQLRRQHCRRNRILDPPGSYRPQESVSSIPTFSRHPWSNSDRRSIPDIASLAACLGVRLDPVLAPRCHTQFF